MVFGDIANQSGNPLKHNTREKMTAPKGTDAFTTKASKSAEARHIRMIREQVEKHPEIDIRKEVSIEFLTNGENSYSIKKNGSSQGWRSDGGFLFIDEELVGIAEAKYQKERQNACERLCRYFLIDEFRQDPWRVFVSVDGLGFEKQLGGGSTGSLIDMARHAGVTLLDNASDEDLREGIRIWLERIIKESENK